MVSQATHSAHTLVPDALCQPEIATLRHADDPPHSLLDFLFGDGRRLRQLIHALPPFVPGVVLLALFPPDIHCNISVVEEVGLETIMK